MHCLKYIVGNGNKQHSKKQTIRQVRNAKKGFRGFLASSNYNLA